MKLSRSAALAHAWVARLLATVGAHSAPKAAEDAGYGQPEMVETEAGVELRLYGDVIPHAYAMWFMPGEAVSDVGFMAALDKVPADKAVLVTINSLGGDVFAGTAIANAIARRKATTQVDGIAASIASVILAAGSKSHVMRGATVMIHKPWSYAAGNAPSLRAEADVLDKIEEAMLDIYVGKSGKKYTRDQWRAALTGPDGADGSWWTGAEAVAYGIADTYEQPKEEAPARAAELLTQRKAVAALYCSKLPQNLMDPPAGESANSPKVPATVAPEAKQETRTTARRPGISYLD
jgi:ATP-dependent Clp protease protease subunit